MSREKLRVFVFHTWTFLFSTPLHNCFPHITNTVLLKGCFPTRKWGGITLFSEPLKLKVNKPNDRIYTRSCYEGKEKIPRVQRGHHPTSVIVWWGVFVSKWQMDCVCAMRRNLWKKIVNAVGHFITKLTSNKRRSERHTKIIIDMMSQNLIKIKKNLQMYWSDIRSGTDSTQDYNRTGVEANLIGLWTLKWDGRD